jgi:hypothetical protein
MPFPEQVASANNIVYTFSETMRYVLLKASCQSGKTGCFQTVIGKMLASGRIQRAYILCGSNETELRLQAMLDTAAANPNYYKIDAKGKPLDSNAITVLFRQDFKGAAFVPVNALVVVDESHLDQGHEQELACFLREHGLDMTGNPAPLMKVNAFLLSVSATPYSEMASIEHKETPHPKHVEIMAAGKGYFGLHDYLFKGHMKKTFPVASAVLRFAQLLRAGGKKKYALVRLSSGKAAAAEEKAMRQACAMVKGRVLRFTAQHTEISICRDDSSLPCLEDAPEVPTLVLLSGRLRAGKVVPKRHISFVWEGAAASKTDALVQGLAGRMCGYEGDDDVFKLGEEKPLIFVPASSLAQNEKKVVKASEIERAFMDPVVIPMKATNLKKSRLANAAANGTVQCPPLRLEWPSAAADEWTPQTAQEGDDIGEHCRELLMKNLTVIDSAPFSDEQKEEIKSFVATAFPHTRTLQQSVSATFKRYFGAVIEACASKTAVAENVSDFSPMTFFITKDALVPHSNLRHLYVIFYTKAKGVGCGITTTPIDSRFAHTNGKSHFTPHDSHMDRPSAACGGVAFDEASIAKPELFEAALREYLKQWSGSTQLTYSRSIQDVKGRFTLSKAFYAYEGPKQNSMEAVCAKVGAEFGVQPKVKYARPSATHFNVKSISW